jgi:hypothetical protein
MSPTARPLVVSSYIPDEVTFLLSDLSEVALELDLAVRERAIQGGRNYAEMLPVEYSPGPRYLELFAATLDRTARSLAEQVGIVAEMVLAARGPGAVLVSLARAGTPVGILLRRWARQVHGLELPHYSVSIVRGVGIDTVALDHVAAQHDPAQVVFVDGWTGKGAIVQELTAALTAYAGAPFRADLAVLADPGECAHLFGTREDILIPSACLNATVCGLVSRTVYSRELIGPREFHGAKVYRELAGEDQSAHFLDAISDQFGAVQDAVTQRWPVVYAGDRSVTFRGLREVERLQARFDLPSIHLVKPGVGEATRVLIRRLPWKLLIHPDRSDQFAHLLVLAEERGVPVEEYRDMSYSCVGLVRPLSGAAR